MATLGSRIKNLREKRDIKQVDFAKKLGVSNVVLSRYESDERKPDYDTLQTIADFFEVSTDYLLGRKERAPQKLTITKEDVFGYNLKNQRQNKKWLFHDIEKRLDFSIEEYKRYEQGLEIPSEEIQIKLASLFKINVVDFMKIPNHLQSNKYELVGFSNLEQEEIEFQAFANDPSLQKWYKELPKSEEEDLQKLRKMWEIIKNDVNK